MFHQSIYILVERKSTHIIMSNKTSFYMMVNKVRQQNILKGCASMGSRELEKCIFLSLQNSFLASKRMPWVKF